MGFSAARPPASPKKRKQPQEAAALQSLARRATGRLPERNRQTLMGFCTSSLFRAPEGTSPATRAVVESLAYGFTLGAPRSLLLGTTLFGSRPQR
jgi:hypothetical protein